MLDLLLPEPPLLDVAKLAELQAVIPLAKLKDLITLYLVDAELNLEQIVQHQGRGDYDAVSKQAHMIVSTAGNMGAIRTSEAARRLETACRSGDHSGASALIGELTMSCNASSEAMKVWLEEQSAGLKTGAAS